MRRTILPWSVLLLATVAGCGGGHAPDPAYVAEIDAWHAGRVARLTQETGWLSLVGLHALHEGPNVVGTADQGQPARLLGQPRHAPDPAYVAEIDAWHAGRVPAAAAGHGRQQQDGPGQDRPAH
ncbi:MAG: hypothetical protein IH621_18840, partial [Krumholzibacteria bacterium]|nr:hypothetical protein [Candidatus Krumholzibacteria bacterium]